MHLEEKFIFSVQFLVLRDWKGTLYEKYIQKEDALQRLTSRFLFLHIFIIEFFGLPQASVVSDLSKLV
jgi:hypothetical protein